MGEVGRGGGEDGEEGSGPPRGALGRPEGKRRVGGEPKPKWRPKGVRKMGSA